MPKLRVHNFAVSIDGYAAGPDQSINDPVGVKGHGSHDWAFATRTYGQMQGMDGGDQYCLGAASDSSTTSTVARPATRASSS